MIGLRLVSIARRIGKMCLTWMMLILLVSWFGPHEAAYAQTLQDGAAALRIPPPPDEDEPPYNNGRALTQSVPGTMVTNGVYDVSVRMSNTGTTVWSRAGQYRLGAPQGGVWGIERVDVSGNVQPGQATTFNFQVRAPSVPGTYTFHWLMLQEGVEWFGGSTTPLTITVREPINNAAVVSHYQVTQMQAGGRYDVSVTMHNNGESTWTRALQYTLMSQAPHNNMTWGIGRVPLPVEEVRPGESATFNFQVTAPPAAGTYLSQWGMQREGHGSFGQSTGAAPITVVAPPPQVNNALPISISVLPYMETGQRHEVSVTMQNNGTKTWMPGTGYSLGSQNPHDNLIWGVGRVAIATPVAPGQQYTFTFPVTAPAAGSYSMQWGMLQEGVEWFGGSIGAPVTVAEDFSKVTFIHTDGLGSPVARTDGARNVVSRTRYEPYGYVAAGVTPTIGFTGHVNDAETGLTYMQQRYYDPVAGRFLSIDPVVTNISDGSSFSRYSYANVNPYKYVDPDGRSGVPGVIYGAIAGGVGGYVSSGSSFREQLIGTLSGAIIGGGVGFVAPQTSSVAGAAAVGMIASAGGQATGSAANASVDKGITNVKVSDVKVDTVTTVLGGLGSGAGAAVGRGVSQSTMGPIIGRTLEKAGSPTVAGMVAGAVVEGAISGGVERVAPHVKEMIPKNEEK